MQANNLAIKILIAMLLGIGVGLTLNMLPGHQFTDVYLVNGVLDIGGKIFINILKMIVVPIVFVSLVCGTCHLGDARKFGNLAWKTLSLYLFTTAIAITLGITLASLLHIGSGSNLNVPAGFALKSPPALKETIINIFPQNPIAAMAKGNVLQVIVFALLLGLAIAFSGSTGKRIANLFYDLNDITMNLVHILLKFAPYGVFCLVSALLAKMGFQVILDLLGYFLTVLLVLGLHVILTNSILLKFLARLNPIPFFKKMVAAMIFAFSTSSSNVSIPVVLDTVENKLGVNNTVASFIVPLGATINMDGTAIMQGVATVFIANAYNIHLTLVGFLTIILTATLASIGTAGVPSVGLITLTIVLRQVGLPIEGIAMIIGVDRLLDMVRTAVNITGDSAISCVVGKSEHALDLEKYNG